MKNLMVAAALFVLIVCSAEPGPAQRRAPQPKPPAKPATTPTTTAPAPSATPSQQTAAAQVGPIQGRVVDLGWGDSLTVQDSQSKQHRVRLLGIDAPEKEQAFGPAARQKLSALVFGKSVTVEYQKSDRSGRPLGKVLMGSVDVNLEMLKAGLAWYYPNDTDLPLKDRPLYARAEQEARAAKRGLWQDESPQPPWEFRQARRQQQQQQSQTARTEQQPADQSPVEPPPNMPSDVADEKPGRVTDEKPANPEKNTEPGGAQPDSPGAFPKAPAMRVIGDNATRIFYKSGCPEADKVPPGNRVFFNSVEEAERAGFRRTPNCP